MFVKIFGEACLAFAHPMQVGVMWPWSADLIVFVRLLHKFLRLVSLLAGWVGMMMMMMMMMP